MKRLILFELIRRMTSKSDFFRKFRVLIFSAVLILFLTTGLLIWGGVMTFKYAGSLINSAQVQTHVEDLGSRFKTELDSFPQVTLTSCWEKALSLVNVEPWVTRTLDHNLSNLRQACIEPKSQPCHGESCLDSKNKINNSESEQMI